MSTLPLPAGPEPSPFCSTRLPTRVPRLRLGWLGIPEVVVVVVIVLALVALAVDNRPVPAALAVIAAAVADVIAGRRPSSPTGRRSRRRNR
ncbi:hypothetical protein G3I60_37920 [Streptomyces sp. SID13666]|uniref:hypothetical protein n=1 Tax=unclassified Streptomyces TaxID=2593676 RepID=UPI0013C16B22|nr:MULTISPECIES: hypothetical protein [unclassified Streptomyces]NEA59784.1 hypothetical protein [Streptomyces sp. SID13666]NEA76775.1 hypothetical protein [Streptomyces sp. SID13588]